jgi:hypothetical protein
VNTDDRLTPIHGGGAPRRNTEIQAAQKKEPLAKLEAEKQAIGNKIVDVERELLKRALGRRKREL